MPKLEAKIEQTGQRRTNKIDPNKVMPDDLMAVIYYVKVNNKNYNGDKLSVQELDAGIPNIEITGKDLIKNCLSADQFAEEMEVSMTKMAEIFITSYNRPLKVCFVKQDGEERTLRGRLIQPEPLLGRSHVEDLDLEKGKHRLRLVDHRTIKWLVVDGVKYKAK